ncbi:MAG: glycerate kinase [Phycisphaerae bacterium]|nr:glycerate kinase [Phycisphaerae bacterium]
MPKVVIAPDSFKGSISATAAASAIAEGVRRAQPSATIIEAPMADGGEGTLEILVQALGGQMRRARVSGAMGDTIDAPIGLIRDATTAVIEIASIAGYSMATTRPRDPLRATTFGVGQAIRVAMETGIEQIILALGGSATVDGGAGMLQALGIIPLDIDRRPIASPAGGGDLIRIDRLAWDRPPEHLEQVEFTIACDVLNPACGPNGAAVVFGPQKGADDSAVAKLDAGLSNWAGVLERMSGRPLRDEPGTGSAGGVALPLLALLNAHIVPGVDLIADAIGLREKIVEADLVITGEGRLDRQSLMGKVVGSVARMAHCANVPCVAVVGTTGDGVASCLSVLDDYEVIGGPIEETTPRLADAAERVLRSLM